MFVGDTLKMMKQKEIWRILNNSRLKSLYCLNLLYYGYSGRYIGDREFIRDFCNYFGRDSSSHPGLWTSIEIEARVSPHRLGTGTSIVDS